MGYDVRMIANLKGTVLRHDNSSIVLDVSSVGYRVFTTTVGLEKAKSAAHDKEISLYTHLSVRENAMDMYGFFEEQELYFFEMLLSVSGIGPKSALSILNIADVDTLQSAISENDSSYLTKVSGIGAKSAQRIVIELQDKIDSVHSKGAQGVRNEDVDVLEALTALGYSHTEVRKVIREISSDIEGTQARIKQALKMLGK